MRFWIRCDAILRIVGFFCMQTVCLIVKFVFFVEELSRHIFCGEEIHRQKKGHN